MELFHLDAVEWDWEQTPSQPAALTSPSGASSSWRPATPPARRSPAGGDRYTRPATAGSARASFNAAAGSGCAPRAAHASARAPRVASPWARKQQSWWAAKQAGGGSGSFSSSYAVSSGGGIARVAGAPSMLRRAARAKELRELAGAAAAARAAETALRAAHAARAAHRAARSAVVGAKRAKGRAARADHLARQDFWDAAERRLLHLPPYLLGRVRDLCVGSGGGAPVPLLPLHECDAVVGFLSERANVGVGARVLRNVHAAAAAAHTPRLGDLSACVRQADMELELEWASTRRLAQLAKQQKLVRTREMVNTKRSAQSQLAKATLALENRRGSTGWR